MAMMLRNTAIVMRRQSGERNRTERHLTQPSITISKKTVSLDIALVGASEVEPCPEVLEVLRKTDLAAIIIAPSNPYLSIDPILAIPAIDAAIRASKAPIIAVSPIVQGMAIKGPTAKIMAELGLEPSAGNIARHYGDLIDGFILDATDGNMAEQIESSDLKVTSCDTIMRSLEDKVRVANVSLDFAHSIRHQ